MIRCGRLHMPKPPHSLLAFCLIPFMCTSFMDAPQTDNTKQRKQQASGKATSLTMHLHKKKYGNWIKIWTCPTLQMCVKTLTHEWTADKPWSKGIECAEIVESGNVCALASSCNSTELPGASRNWFTGSSDFRTSFRCSSAWVKTCGSYDSVYNRKRTLSDERN